MQDYRNIRELVCFIQYERESTKNFKQFLCGVISKVILHVIIFYCIKLVLTFLGNVLGGLMLTPRVMVGGMVSASLFLTVSFCHISSFHIFPSMTNSSYTLISISFNAMCPTLLLIILSSMRAHPI